MLTAHLPSGYVLARLIPSAPGFFAAALVGSVLPDLDMFWFHFVDNASIHHHRYWVHIPLFWAAIAALVLPFLALFYRHLLPIGGVFFLALFMHLVLDSISGGILWGMPFDNHLYALVEVPATQSHWVLSFMLHWTFLFELAIWAMALLLWRLEKRP